MRAIVSVIATSLVGCGYARSLGDEAPGASSFPDGSSSPDALSFPDGPSMVSNWKGEYFPNTTLAGDSRSRDEGASSLYYYWESGSPMPDLPADNFSVRFTRTLSLSAGTYRFTARTDDGVSLWVDGVSVIENWKDQGPTVCIADRVLTAGIHTIRMDYYERGGEATAQLSWPIQSSTVCADLSEASCNDNPTCQWFSCGVDMCLPRYTAAQPTCTCAANTTREYCDADKNRGCGWFDCKGKCLASGTSVYSVCRQPDNEPCVF